MGDLVDIAADIYPGWAPNVTMLNFTLASLGNDDPFIFSTTIAQGGIPVASNGTFPSRLELDEDSGDIVGVADVLSDLTTYPVTCVAYPKSFPAPDDFRAIVSRSRNGPRLFVKAWGREGFVDEVTGEMIGFWEQANSTENRYPVNASVPPYFCAVFWLGLNAIGQSSYSTGIISVAFHTVRNSGSASAVYPGNSAFSSYEIYLFLGAIPFWALCVLCIILYPSYVFVQFCCRGTRLEGCLRTICCGRYIDPVTLDERVESDDKAKVNQAAEAEKTRKSPIRGRSSRRLLTQARSQKSRRRLLGGLDAEDEEEDEEDKDPSSEVVKRYQNAIDKILTSPHVSKRLCFLLVAALSIPCIAALVIGRGLANADADAIFFHVRSILEDASNSSSFALKTINSTMETIVELNNTLNPVYVNQSLVVLSLARDRVARLLSLAEPKNLRVDGSTISSLMIPNEAQLIIEIITFAVQLVGPALILMSVVLASCTCRWGDAVLFENVSVCIGLTLKGWLVLCATLAWFCVVFFFWNTSVVADVCFQPSILFVPNVTVDLRPMAAPVMYDVEDNNYYYPYDYKANVLASFYWQCRFNSPYRISSITNFTETSFGFSQYNPLSFLAIQANQFGSIAGALAVDAGDNNTLRSLAQVETLLKDTLQAVQCDSLGDPIRRGMEALCGSNITGYFLSFFFLCTLAIIYMIVIPCTQWISPNLFRQWQANRMYERASKETERIIKFASKMARTSGSVKSGSGSMKSPRRSSSFTSFPRLRQFAAASTAPRKGSITQSLPQTTPANAQGPTSPVNTGSGGSFSHQLGLPQHSSGGASASSGAAVTNQAGGEASAPRKSSTVDDLDLAVV